IHAGPVRWSRRRWRRIRLAGCDPGRRPPAPDRSDPRRDIRPGRIQGHQLHEDRTRFRDRIGRRPKNAREVTMNVDDGKKSRVVVKSYCVKNAIPTEEQFAQLIDSVLNERDDGLVKIAGDPLAVEAAGDDTSFKKALNFYTKLSDSDPAWTLSLRPRAVPA